MEDCLHNTERECDEERVKKLEKSKEMWWWSMSYIVATEIFPKEMAN